MSDKLANALAGDDQLPEEYWRRFEEPPAVTTADALAYRDPYEQEVAELQNRLHAAQDREGYDALARLVAALIPGVNLAHRALTKSGGAFDPLMREAANTHYKIEQRHNPSTGLNAFNKPVMDAYYRYSVPPLMAAARRWNDIMESPAAYREYMTSGRGLSNRDVNLLGDSTHHMKGHAKDTADILDRLIRMNPRNEKVIY